jgi:hypothetical protein
VFASAVRCKSIAPLIANGFRRSLLAGLYQTAA